MAVSIDALIEKSNAEFYTLGHEHGYDVGYQQGILLAVKMLQDGITANEVMAVNEPYPDGEAVYSIPGNPEATFEENDAYWTDIDHLDTIITTHIEPGEQKKKITRAKHIKHKWTKDISDALEVEIANGRMVNDLAEKNNIGLTANAIRKQLWKLGYRCPNKNGIYTKKQGA